MKLKKHKSLILKVDLVKVYDRVNKDLLQLVLLHVGLSLEATNWVMGYVNSVNFYILVNGGPTYFFKISRGLR